ncbi:GTP-binding protein [Alcaligenaceae bacterium]|nr:GTP-binding protein [Alcaligenaceae bacterium]
MSNLKNDDARYTVNVLTGFLGSGKTTLLRRLLASAAFSNCAVLINELGEIGLDHELLDQVDQETIVLRNGCICCGIRSDLAGALLSLNERRDRGILPPFDRVVIETTGLADPVPVINTVISDPALHHHYRIGTVVTTVDAVYGLAQLSERAESVKQAAIADRIVITKADLVEPDKLEALRIALSQVNPSSSIITSRNDASEPEVLMSRDIGDGDRRDEAAQWFAGNGASLTMGKPSPSLFGEGGKRLGPIHGSGIETVSLTIDEPLDWIAFGVWFSMLLHRYGSVILRVKGILNLRGVNVPTVIHGVQHLIHPPTHLDSWPSPDRRSRLVLIGFLPDAAQLQRSLEVFSKTS